MLASRSDEEIKKDVIHRLTWDDRVDAAKIIVDVKDGKVTLTGSVPSYLARSAAYDDVWTVRGVRSVVNELSVKPLKTPSDEEIRTRVEDRLLTSPAFETADIDVEVHNGIVKLKGTVDALWKRTSAETITEGLRGVVDVKNELAVVPTGDFMDEDIARRIIDSLDRDARVDAEDVTVNVRNGIVTLTGTVPDRYAREAAYEAALYTTGVKEIHDQLTVSGLALAA